MAFSQPLGESPTGYPVPGNYSINGWLSGLDALMARLFAVQHLAIPKANEPLGLQLDPQTHVITQVHPGSLAQRHGVNAGDVLIGINETGLTLFEYAPGPVEDTLHVKIDTIAASSDAMAVVGQLQQAYLTLHLLKPIDESVRARAMMASPDATFSPASTFTGARPGWEYKSGLKGVGYYKGEPSAPAPPTAVAQRTASTMAPLSAKQFMDQFPRSSKGQRRPDPQEQQPPPQVQQLAPPTRTPQGDPSLALRMYPWATKFEDAQGAVRNRYNMPNGAVLQPMVVLQGSQQLETIRRKEAAFAVMRPGTSGFSSFLNRS